MIIILPKKFSEKHISTFINDFYRNIKAFPTDTYYFDFSESEWISNQSLLLLSGLIKYLYKTNRKFKINLFKINPEFINERQAKQIYQIWEVWKLHKIFDDSHFENYVENFQNSTIPYLVNKYGISTTNYEIFDRIGVTPFISLNFIKDYIDEDIVNFQIEPIFKLNTAVNDELSLSECEHPFIENTLSTIISKELYENFLDHFGNSVFNSNHNWAYMSISLKRKEKQKEDSQKRFKYNFETEELEEAKTFFCKNNIYKNESIIQFSFLDFGNGISATLKEQYLIENKILQETLFETVDDNLILKYAFKHNTSRHPILDKHNEIEKYIPRGLFDLLIIVKRYKGLIIVRSNFGKILYNFSNTDSIEEAYSVFGKDNEYFPGTFISIYLPAFSKNKKYNKTVIRPELKPEFHLFKKGGKKARNINLFSIQSKIENNKKDRNRNLIKALQEVLSEDEDIIRLNYISFFGVEDESIIRKSIFYLLTDYEVNEYNSIIIVYPPSKNIIQEINNEILELNSIIINLDYAMLKFGKLIFLFKHSSFSC